MKKLLTMLTVAPLSAGLLTSCGGSSSWAAPEGYSALSFTVSVPQSGSEFWKNLGRSTSNSFDNFGIPFKQVEVDFNKLTEDIDPGSDVKDFNAFALAVSESLTPNPYQYWHPENSVAGKDNTSRISINTDLGREYETKVDAVTGATTEAAYKTALWDFVKLQNKNNFMLPLYANNYHTFVRETLTNAEDPQNTDAGATADYASLTRGDANFAFRPGFTTHHDDLANFIYKGAKTADGSIMRTNLTEPGRDFNPIGKPNAYDVEARGFLYDSTYAIDAGGNIRKWLFNEDISTLSGTSFTMTLNSAATHVSVEDVVYSFLSTAHKDYSGANTNPFKDYFKKLSYDKAAKSVTVEFKSDKYLNRDALLSTVFDITPLNDTVFASKMAAATGEFVPDATTDTFDDSTFKISLLENFANTANGVDVTKWNALSTGFYKVKTDNGDGQGLVFARKIGTEQATAPKALNDVLDYFMPVQDEILFNEFNDTGAMLTNYKEGKLDVVQAVGTATHIPEFKAAGAKYDTYLRNGYGYVRMRYDIAPFHKQEVRQAMGYLIDRERFLAANFLKGNDYDPARPETDNFYATTLDAPYSKSSSIFNGIEKEAGWIDYPSGHNYTKAEELLKAAGLKKHDGRWVYPSAWVKELADDIAS